MNIDAYDFSNNLLENLSNIYNEYGEKFNIMSNDPIFNFKVRLIKKQGYYDKSFEYYTLYSKKNGYYIFRVVFIDYLTKKIDNGCYLEDIHKTHNYTGTEIVQFVLHLLKKLSIERVHLIDDAKIKGSIPLSWYKFLEKGETFYQRFGFKLILSQNFFTNIKYGCNNETLNKLLERERSRLAKASITDFIKPFKNIPEDVVEIICNCKTFNNITLLSKDINYLINIFIESNDSLLTFLFSLNIKTLSKVIKILTSDNLIIKIKTTEGYIKFPLCKSLSIINNILNISVLELKF